MHIFGEPLAGRSGHTAGRQLLERLYRQITGEAMPPIVLARGGKPGFARGPWYFSITHTKHYVFVALALEPVGIDGEELGRQVSEQLPRRVLSQAEYAEYQQAEDKSRAFLTFWVLKEARAKCSGRGLRYPENQTNFTLSDPRVQEQLGCLVAVVTEESMLFDTHAHMDDRAFDEDRDALLASLPEAGVRLVMNPGCSLESSRNVDKLTKAYDFLYGAVGSHPDVADEVNEDVLAEYAELCKQNSKLRAIGEIGLDYHYEDIPRQIQQRAFRLQLGLARELGLPVIIHDRDAHGDCLEILRDFPEVRGVFHCYSGSLEMARELVKQGWFIGFTGVLTFKNARKALEVAAAIPLEQLVLETDCPYMAPEPYRGKRNHPGYLHRMAEKLAELRGLPLEEIRRITTENGKRLYGL